MFLINLFVSLILAVTILMLILILFVRMGSRGVSPIDPVALIRPMPHGSRRNATAYDLALTAVPNARDIGGYQTADGRVVRKGLFFRSGALGGATDEDLDQLAAYGLRQIFDLRSDREVAEKPDRVPKTAEYHHLPIQAEDPARGKVGKLLFQRSMLSQMMMEGYVTTIEERAERFGQILARLAEPDTLPALVHCTAGKDRAGMTAALLLGLLGVPRETIVADYAQSNRAFDFLYADFKGSSTAARLKRIGIPFDDLSGLLVADPAWIESMLDYIEARYETIERYLIERAGLTRVQIEKIRENLLEL